MNDIAIIAVGGYEEIGRNMTAIRIGKDIVVIDMGIRLDRVQIHEDTELGSSLFGVGVTGDTNPQGCQPSHLE
jgi:mRNA degradation ribonuclease J1/J2